MWQQLTIFEAFIPCQSFISYRETPIIPISSPSVTKKICLISIREIKLTFNHCPMSHNSNDFTHRTAINRRSCNGMTSVSFEVRAKGKGCNHTKQIKFPSIWLLQVCIRGCLWNRHWGSRLKSSIICRMYCTWYPQLHEGLALAPQWCKNYPDLLCPVRKRFNFTHNLHESLNPGGRSDA